jgi:hypothetical protein
MRANGKMVAFPGKENNIWKIIRCMKVNSNKINLKDKVYSIKLMEHLSMEYGKIVNWL